MSLLPSFRHTLRQQKLVFSPKRFSCHETIVSLRLRRSYPRATWLGIAGGVGLSMATTASLSPVLCESAASSESRSGTSLAGSHFQTTLREDTTTASSPPPPPSSVNLYQLSFGTVTGVCAGIFIKKGVKALAFFIGGVFVLLQYFNSLSLIRVDWAHAGSKFESLFYTTDARGVRRPPNVVSLWRWIVDFLTADFQPRASFLAGLALGIRIG